jgi:intracellular sulfur oxidation DsrE/DsrF family protein
MSFASHHRAIVRTMSVLVAVALAAPATAQQPAPKAGKAHTAALKTPSRPNPGKGRKLAIQVDENNPQVMNLALNNAKNVVDYFKAKGETVAIEIVAFGPGLHMLREDTSPVKQRIAQMSLEEPSITFIACANTRANQSKAEHKEITLISEAKLMPSGVVRLMELQAKGYAYIRP